MAIPLSREEQAGSERRLITKPINEKAVVVVTVPQINYVQNWDKN